MANRFYQRHVISVADLDRADLELVVNMATSLKARPRHDLLKGRLVGSCFFEPSTRTRLSFEAAVQRLGGRVIGFDSATNTSSGAKGETLADSIQVVGSYADAIVIRHPREGAARLASEFSGVPVINGGDGANQHPTQTLLDLFSIFETQGRLDNLKVAFVGDLKYGRTVHSLSQALSRFDGNRFTFVAPDALQMPDYLLAELDQGGVPWHRSDALAPSIQEADIVYITRVQKERLDETEYQFIKSRFVLTLRDLEGVRPGLRVLHPLPRVDEIHPDVDATAHAYYFQQAANGVYARQALLGLCLNPAFGE
jgi:aspartate carbamoyltransferase catalytic subunit